MTNQFIQPYADIELSKNITNTFFTQNGALALIYELNISKKDNGFSYHFTASPYIEYIINFNETKKYFSIHFLYGNTSKNIEITETGKFFCIRTMCPLFLIPVKCSKTMIPANILNKHTIVNIFPNDPEYNLFYNIHNSLSFGQKIIFFNECLKKYTYMQHSPSGIYSITSAIRDSNGEITINELSEIFGYSVRHICRLFKNYFGFGPKEFCNLVRFHKTINEIFKDPQKSNSEFITEIGYSDQAHFQREFKKYMNMTPKKFISMYLNK